MTAPSLQDRMFDQLRDQRLLDQARVCAGEYLDDSLRRPVAPSAQALAGLQAFREALPEEPASGEDILKLLHGFGAPATLASTGGRYFGFVNGGVLPAALAAKWLADTWDQNAALA
ncbi:MAG: hypothetical protein K9J43_03355, partial [Polynucleobacter sp.]|nr:hypothetical protein [Polynucleobacter sp.]